MIDDEETSGTAILAKQDALEQAAAQLLGRILFAYSRLDVSLGLCIAWAGGGQRVEAISRKIGKWDLHKRLGRLAKDVEASGLDSGARSAYARWIEDVDAVREERNRMVHGRWGVDASRERVVNVVGLPSSPVQGEQAYALADLVSFLGTVKKADEGAVGSSSASSAWQGRHRSSPASGEKG